MTKRRGGEDPYGGISSMCEGGRGGRGGRGNEKYDADGDELNGDEVNGELLQWRAATRNGVALTIAGYNWEVGRGAMSRWWDC